MKPRNHNHPNMPLKRTIEYGAAGVVIIMLLGALGLLLLPLLTSAPGGFAFAAVLVVLLIPAVLMLTAYAPPVSVDKDAITLHPALWQTQRIPWSDITEVRVYPLLPREDTEIPRKYVVGTRNYKPAAGIMLVIPSLPWPYRMVGFFAGVQSRPAIALTNRAHTDYEHLLQAILQQTDATTHADDLLESPSARLD